jgi:hypothetical protein
MRACRPSDFLFPLDSVHLLFNSHWVLTRLKIINTWAFSFLPSRSLTGKMTFVKSNSLVLHTLLLYLPKATNAKGVSEIDVFHLLYYTEDYCIKIDSFFWLLLCSFQCFPWGGLTLLRCLGYLLCVQGEWCSIISQLQFWLQRNWYFFVKRFRSGCHCCIRKPGQWVWFQVIQTQHWKASECQHMLWWRCCVTWRR